MRSAVSGLMPACSKMVIMNRMRTVKSQGVKLGLHCPGDMRTHIPQLRSGLVLSAPLHMKHRPRSRSGPRPSALPDAAQSASYPGFLEYCAPTLSERAPAGEEWAHEIKADGYRAQLHINAG